MGPVVTNITTMQDILAPLLNLFEDKEVQARMMDAVETARIYYTSDDVTVNLIWSILVLGVILLLLKPLLGIPLLDNLLGAMTGSSPSYGSGISSDYGAPAGGYGAPDSGYGAPDAGYGAPDAGYGAPAGDSGFNPGSSYDSPDSGYSAPQSGYSRGRRSVSLTEQQKSLYDIVKPQPELQSPLLASLALRAPVAPALEFARLS